MVRRRLRRSAAYVGKTADNSPLWLVSFADIVTLMLCFLVMLVSMSIFDEQSSREVLGSVSSTFGKGSNLSRTLISGLSGRTAVLPDQLQHSSSDVLRSMLLEEIGEQVNIQENAYVQIISISDTMLFSPGQTELSDQGTLFLDRLLPYLHTIKHPLLVAGHATPQQDELGILFRATDESAHSSPWRISFLRANAVYRHMLNRGIAPALLSVEAFGEYRPLTSNDTPKERSRNRRVDLVLDKRNTTDDDLIKRISVPKKEPESTQYKGFTFDLAVPPPSASPKLSSDDEAQP